MADSRYVEVNPTYRCFVAAKSLGATADLSSRVLGLRQSQAEIHAMAEKSTIHERDCPLLQHDASYPFFTFAMNTLLSLPCFSH